MLFVSGLALLKARVPEHNKSVSANCNARIDTAERQKQVLVEEGSRLQTPVQPWHERDSAGRLQHGVHYVSEWSPAHPWHTLRGARSSVLYAAAFEVLPRGTPRLLSEPLCIERR